MECSIGGLTSSGMTAEQQRKRPWELRMFHWKVSDPPEFRNAVLGWQNIPMEAAVVLRFL